MSGLIITLAQQKGGAGKTTVAAHLAIAFALGGKSVAILDTDPQGSIGQWFERREATLGADKTLLTFRTASGWGARREARGMARDHDIVVLDTPPKSDVELRPAFEAANLVAVPIQPAPVDLWATEPTLAMVQKAGARCLLIMNRVIRGSLISAEIAQAVTAFGQSVATIQLGSRVAFAASMGQGQTVMETAPHSFAASEVYDLAIEVMAHANGVSSERRASSSGGGRAVSRPPLVAAGGSRR
jgi:chromosome partitioning protein